mmetsp:Transcript_28518/g.41965  ORF Transcript_28518/g.41965 Transcript_28518/m.41965 type:complete len:90 (+) Transcript_28518:904-1173(+)
MKYPMHHIEPVFTLEQLDFSAGMVKKVFGRRFACHSFLIFHFQLASTIEPCFVVNRAGHVCFHCIYAVCKIGSILRCLDGEAISDVFVI